MHTHFALGIARSVYPATSVELDEVMAYIIQFILLKYLEVVINLSKDPSGRLIGMLCLNTDISAAQNLIGATR